MTVHRAYVSHRISGDALLVGGGPLFHLSSIPQLRGKLRVYIDNTEVKK
jgi:hypothetical protein